MISDDLKSRIDDGRAGRNRGFSTGSKKLDSIIQGVQGGTYTLIGGNTGCVLGSTRIKVRKISNNSNYFITKVGNIS